MNTKILEATAILKGKNIPILNTEMDISADWDIQLQKEETLVRLNINVKSVYGDFHWVDNCGHYKKKVEIHFSTEDWATKVVNNISGYQEIIEPFKVKIDFDNKSVTVFFSDGI
jgi:hypothetical protein